MKIVIAPASFKESLSATEVARAIYQGFHVNFPQAEFIVQAMADGGEGSIACLKDPMQCSLHNVMVNDPLSRPHLAQFASSGDLALIEVAQASGLGLVPVQQRNPLEANSFGTGELIRAALDQGFRKFILLMG